MFHWRMKVLCIYNVVFFQEPLYSKEPLAFLRHMLIYRGSSLHKIYMTLHIKRSNSIFDIQSIHSQCRNTCWRKRGKRCSEDQGTREEHRWSHPGGHWDYRVPLTGDLSVKTPSFRPFTRWRVMIRVLYDHHRVREMSFACCTRLMLYYKIWNVVGSTDEHHVWLTRKRHVVFN